ncbi:MAG: IMP dehydrogenase [Beggiatoa sp. IS2]|nr:MAG: IMP dehydrogenase [Beggiatoa sp. IS2]
MAIRVALNHYTRYRYDRSVSLFPHVIRLRPAAHCRTPIQAYSLQIKPKGHFINWQQDPFGNYLARAVFPEKTRELSVEVDLVAELTVINPFDFFVEEYSEKYPFQYEEKLAKELIPYLEIVEHTPLLIKWLHGVDRTPQRIVDFMVYLNRRLYKAIDYTVRLEPGVQTCDETLSKGSGSCRDSAWLLVQILRHLGLAARFVSGYLIQLTADVKSLDGPSGPEKDFTDLHAWAEVYIPGAGWVGLDPTSGLLAGEGHIPLACTPDPGNAAPITGAVDKCETVFHFHNKVKRIYEDPRVTKPYTETQWQAIEALGHQVDTDLQAGDVRLTMGGEPTFVSIDDRDGAEWNTEALGLTKHFLANHLLKRLRNRFAVGGLLHYGQGKWYPGEPLPRWALGCFWRKDGVVIWQNEELFADKSQHYGYTAKHAKRFIQYLAQRLGIESQSIVPGYEDTLYYLWKEGNLPVNIDPLKLNLKDDYERKRLARLLSHGLNTPAGYVLPLRWNESAVQDAPAWHSNPWTFRRGYMYLIPGDSPMGLRLPLDSLPWVAKEKRQIFQERSLFEELSVLPDFHAKTLHRYAQWYESGRVPTHEITTLIETREVLYQQQTPEKPRFEEIYAEVIHTALCVEAREGFLHVFLPPLTALEQYLDLVACVEATAHELKMPVFLEGYEPPRDPRLARLLITPDPGVIEVNIHPAYNWDELVHNTTVLYEEAYFARLGTEKFMVDGRHTGTGGGNHVTLGGPTPADSPILRRPDLLRSLITYWQHHPSLSYLFSGLFIGPTSQAPRIDEARDDSLYELEIAFQRVPAGGTPAPWLVDRLLRNLLVDVTGNTHRAEFCIDKLYSPDSTSGRLGLVEMRAFEMPPHARMSLMQMLLLRALIAHFWKTPYNFHLVRWGTELHDRFMLPHFIRQDMKDIVRELQTAGYPFQMEWLDPFFEFRFPHYGSVQVGNIKMDLHLAIEPWHVLGEEVTAMGTSRFVDSSVERLQIKLTGMTDSRHIIACNGRYVPLHKTDTHGEYVAGVRYRAWQPYSALHPTIPVHSPLVFDIIDTWNGRAIGGCTYHVVHPGGRGYEDFPVNAYVAEARRISRFEPFGHTPGPIQPPPEIQSLAKFYPQGHPVGPMTPPVEEPNSDYPYTLDLRRERTS